MMAHRIPFRGDIGQALVELALVLPVFLLLLVGAFVVGRLAYADIEVSNAARAGVAYAMQSHTTAADTGQTGGIVQAALHDAPNIQSLVVDPPILTCYCETSGGVTTALASCLFADANLTTCPSPSSIVIYVQVNTHAQVDTAFHVPGIANLVTLQGTAIMRVEQD
jgi:Flp pilus assembly protein TadG